MDYTYDTTLRSVERSLSRLKVDRLDAVFIHDLDPGFAGTAYREQLKTAVEGAFPALQRLKDCGRGDRGRQHELGGLFGLR